MLKLSLVFGIFAVLATNGHVINQLSRDYPSKIIGGHDVDIKDFPYQASIEYGTIFMCAASIYTEKLVITAGHCVQGINPYNTKIRVGSSTGISDGSLHQADFMTHHERFSRITSDYDVAVITVSEPFKLGTTGVNKIALATVEQTFGSGTVSGWGSTNEEEFKPPTTLQAVTVPLVDRKTCSDYESVFNRTVTDRMICAGSVGKDSCFGDSGGPLVIDGKLAGIVSWGIGCGRENSPGVFTNIANKDITDFINQYVEFLNKN